MWIVAIAWIYVVGLMAVTQNSVLAGIMTFLGYCVLPLSLVLYVFGGRGRAQRRARRGAQPGGSIDNDTSTLYASSSDSMLYSSSSSSSSDDSGNSRNGSDCTSTDSGSTDSSCSDSGSSDSSSSSSSSD